MPDRLPGWTAHLVRPRDEDGRQDGPGEQEGYPRPPRQQARQRLPRGRQLVHTARQEGSQSLHDVRCLSIAIFLRLGGLSFDALTCAQS